MKVLTLKKNSEKSVLLILAFILFTLLILLEYLPEKYLIYQLTLLTTVCISAIIIALVISSKSELTICHHGVFYRSMFGNFHIEASRVKLLRHYSKCGFHCVIMFGDRFFLFAPFYTLTSRQTQGLKRYNSNLLNWLHEKSKHRKLL